MGALIHTLPYTPANTTADESKKVGDTIGQDKGKTLSKTLVEAVEVVKVQTFGNTLSDEKAEAIQNIQA